MKWQYNPEQLDFGTYAYKRKNTDTPSMVEVSILSGIPTDTRGWWLGPLNTAGLDMQKLTCVCGNCQCWTRKGKSLYGFCHRYPPVDNNWSVSHELERCWEFIPAKIEETEDG